MTEPVEQFEGLLAAGNVQQATALLQQYAAAGDPAARFLLAIHLLSGELLPRDLPRSRLMLRICAEEGNPAAAMLEIALTANGTGGDADWGTARRLLEKLSGSSDEARRQCDLLSTMNLDTNGRPNPVPVGQIVNERPAIRYYRAALSFDECEYVASSAVDIMAPAVVVDPRTGRMVNHPVRTSDGAVIGPGRENLVIRAINSRIAAFTETHIEQGEPLAVLRYAPGQEYRTHLDAISGAANQRIRTAIIYLNHGYEGGATLFNKLGISVTGRTGDMLVFDNVLSNGAIDQASEHSGRPVRRGVKWIATRWIREHSYDPWAGH